jgi:hypothetical protein
MLSTTTRIFEGLDRMPTPTFPAQDAEFTQALATIVLSNHNDVIQNMAMGVKSFQRELGSDFTHVVSHVV